MNLRFRNGLPRGGIGYLGVDVAAGAVFFASYGPDRASILVAAIALPPCLWLGLGLRADGEEGEVTDQVTWESSKRNDVFDLKDHDVSEFRLSSAVILAGLVGITIALWRRYGASWST